MNVIFIGIAGIILGVSAYMLGFYNGVNKTTDVYEYRKYRRD